MAKKSNKQLEKEKKNLSKIMQRLSKKLDAVLKTLWNKESLINYLISEILTSFSFFMLSVR